jgi:outer membrane lipoprotein-sorting protein
MTARHWSVCPPPATLVMLMAMVAALTAVVPLGQAQAAEDPPIPQLSPEQASLLDRITAQARDVRTISGHFQQRTLNPGDSQAEVRDGRFSIQVPDCYNLIETRPDDANWRKRICSDGLTQWEIEQVFPDVRPMKSQHQAGAADHDLRRILSCVRGDITELQRDFAITPKEVPTGFQLTLLPRTSEVAKDVAQAVIQLDAHSHVQSLVLEQPAGTRISLEISAAVYNQPVKPEDFHDQDP